ncbi:PREDICTED: dopamine receptor 2-like [Branchiostoma belcheri]|uniref:Dopamine receptor 2-like n=1 Tax=Branchiostoma belcheri TaxID=7741 RepID=A0A6P5A4N7_BRABE|nr:PREDICTED: dopamine receptor 2-like [Branchiostoma belcheri]XP_019644454.1 PREDICTED: dopamine receptor 2-like [Branchiostoma belcheri]
MNASNVTFPPTGIAAPQGGAGPIVILVLSLFTVFTIAGNLLVIAVVYRDRKLRTVTNYLIVSLAFADLLIGSLVMPFGISLEVTGGEWLFGKLWCDIWHSLDVMGSTASILNLCAISLDRYWAITDPVLYPCRVTVGRARLMIALVWLCSAAISFPAIAWWQAVGDPSSPDHLCLFTSDTTYLATSSCVSFYVPLLIMLFTYYRIYRIAARQRKSLMQGVKVFDADGKDGESLSLRVHRGGGSAAGRKESLVPCGNGAVSNSERLSQAANDKKLRQIKIAKRLQKFTKEHKAAKTLSIVIGVFILCWLPFFVLNIIISACSFQCIDGVDFLYAIFTWLGYVNSGFNPIIYACSSIEFRRAFAKTLCQYCPKGLCKRKHFPGYSVRSALATVTVEMLQSRHNEEMPNGSARRYNRRTTI